MKLLLLFLALIGATITAFGQQTLTVVFSTAELTNTLPSALRPMMAVVPQDGQSWSMWRFVPNSSALLGQSVLPTKNNTGRWIWIPYSGRMDGGTIEQSTFVSQTHGFSIYSPTITRGFAYNYTTATNGFTYSHDAGAAKFGDVYYAFWNATTNVIQEAGPGQRNFMTTSTDWTTWGPVVSPFVSQTYSSNPVPYDADDVQWQPNPLVITSPAGPQLIVSWSQQSDIYASTYPMSQQSYVSIKRTTNSLFQNVALPTTLRVGTNTYWSFPCQNPLQLLSGRILVPVIWISTNTWSAMPSTVSSNAFTASYKFAGIVYSDDYGTNWTSGGYATQPGAPWSPWELTLTKQKNGGVRAWCRSLWIGDSPGLMLSAQVFGDGIAMGGLEKSYYEVPSSRMGSFGSEGGMEYWVMNDQPQSLRSYLGRANVALWTSRTGGDDYMPGIGLTEEEIPAQYPQGFVSDGQLFLIYTSGNPYSIKTVKISAAPPLGTQSIFLRSNDKQNIGAVYQAGPPAVFQFPAGIPRVQSIPTTAAWAGTNFSMGLWMARTNIDHQAASLFDNRNGAAVSNPTGMLIGLIYPTTIPTVTAGIIRANLYTSTNAAINYDIGGFVIPTNSWFYVGVSMSDTLMTAWIVDAAGTVQTGTAAMGTPYRSIASDIGAIVGGTTLGSSVESINGYVRSMRIYPGVNLTANNQRYLHGLDQSALGVSDWSGTETSPGAATLALSAVDYPGSNTAGWRLNWTPLGISYRGNAESAVYAGHNTVKLSGTGSASLDLPPSNLLDGDVVQVTTSFNVPYAPTNTLKLFTLGSVVSPVYIQRSINRPDEIELYDYFTGLTKTIATLVTNQWVPIVIQFGRGTVSVSVEGSGAVSVPGRDANAKLFLGQGYLDVANTDPGQVVYFDIGATKSFVGKDRSSPRDPPGAPYVSTNMIVGAFPRVTLWETDVVSTNESRAWGIGVQSDVLRIGTGALIATNVNLTITRDGAITITSRAQTVVYQHANNPDAAYGPLYYFQRGAGSLEFPQPSSNNFTIGGLRFQSVIDTNGTYGTGVGGITGKDVGPQSTTNNGKKIVFATVRTNEVAAEDVMFLENDTLETLTGRIMIRGFNPKISTAADPGTNSPTGLTFDSTGDVTQMTNAFIWQQNGTNMAILDTTGLLRLLGGLMVNGSIMASNSAAQIGGRSANGSSGLTVLAAGITGRFIGFAEGTPAFPGTEWWRMQTNSLQLVSGVGPGWFNGDNSPENSVAAPVGSFYLRKNGGAGTSFYVKESGTGNTGWVAK